MKKLMFVTVLALVALAVAVAFAQAPVGRERPRMVGQARGGSSLLKLFDADKDGKITQQEWVDAFKKIDSDGNGVITKEELESFRQKTQEETRKKMFEKMDADGSGTISKEEFPGPDNRFDKIDANSDGQITPEELKEAAEKMRKIREEGGKDPVWKQHKKPESKEDSNTGE